jgi:poly(A) polymerase
MDHIALSALLLADDPAALAAAWPAVAAAVPELAALDMDQGGRRLHKDNVAHTIAVVAKMPRTERLRLTALFHDIGKPPTRRIDAGHVTFHDHERVGARLTRVVMDRLGYPLQLTAEVATLVELSGATKGSEIWTDAAVRRFVSQAGDLLDDLLVFAERDVTSRHAHKHREVSAQVAALRGRNAAVAALDAERARRPVVDGRAIMQRYGLAPGPRVGELLGLLLEAQRREALTVEQAWTMLDTALAAPADAR